MNIWKYNFPHAKCFRFLCRSVCYWYLLYQQCSFLGRTQDPHEHKKPEIWKIAEIVSNWIRKWRKRWSTAKWNAFDCENSIWKHSAKFLSWDQKVSNMNISKCNVEHSKCFSFVLRRARYSYLCFLRAFVHIFCLSVLVFAGEQVPEDVLGREWLKEENLGSGKLGDRKTFLP
jgi:hypothetical protein